MLADGNKPKFTTSWDDGLNWETLEATAKGNIKRVRKFLGNHIEAVAYVKNTEGGGTGVLLEFKARRNVARRLLINHATLVGDGLEALRFLTDQGYYYDLDCKKMLLKYLFGLGDEVEQVYTLADKTGWVNGSFLTPAKTYGDGDLRFRDPEPDNNMTQIEGTLDGWKREVAAKCAGNSRLLFSLGTAFAAPLLPLAQIESGGFHLVGITSIGKTTALNLAASVAGLKTIPSWRSTSNALEGKAAEFNHMLLPLDELNQADPQTVGASAYMLGNGQGKNRMSKMLSTVKPKTWELLFLSTGEVSMTDYLRQAKIPAKGGMEARMPSIPADAGKGYGVFENLHGYKTSDEFVVALETAIRQHQGTAQDAYLTELVAAHSGASMVGSFDPTGRKPPGCVRQDKVEGFERELRERVHAIASKLSQQFKDTAISRVAIRFALVQVGLELAHSFGLLPFPIEQCGWAVRQLFTAWLDIRGGSGSIEIKEACNRIEHLFVSNQHGDRIADTHNPVNVRNLLAYRHIDDLTKEAEFWVPPAIFYKELAEGIDRKELIKQLQVRGWLKPSLDDRPTLRRRLDRNRQPFFVFGQFWVADEKIPEDLGNDKKAPYPPYPPYPVDEGVTQTDVHLGTAPYPAENPTVPTVPRRSVKNTQAPHLGTAGYGGNNGDVPNRTQPEPLLNNDSEGAGTVGTVGTSKNRDSQNISENNRRGCDEFKIDEAGAPLVGAHVKPADPYHERGQDLGIVKEIEGEQYVVQWKSDSNLRRYIREELRMVA